MLSQQILTKKVVDYLRENHSIRLNLPNLFRSIDSKVTLKYLKSFSMGKKQNRYNILIQRIQELLKRNLLNLQKIKLFSEDFFNTITEDILILEQNERLRRKIPLAKEQILVKNQEIGGFEQNIKAECLLINDKQDILSFISSSLKDYLTKLNIIANEYNNVNKLEILTSINIDDLYQDNITDEDHYLKHYSPLLEVLNKLKFNMIKLYQEIQTSDPYDVPLKCVNFLANCKNLIQEMEPFLLSNDCAFNKMIFFVVKCQKENLQLVASHYEKALVFCRGITSDLFKGYYLAYMFKPIYLQIKQSLQSSRQSLLKLINDQQLPQVKLSQLLKAEVVKLQIVKNKLKEVKSTMIIGKNTIMKAYVSKKQCKKLNLINEAKNQYITLKKMIEKFSKYYQMKKQVQKLQNKQIEESTKIIKQVRILEKINDINQLSEGISKFSDGVSKLSDGMNKFSDSFHKISQNTKTREKITPQKRFEVTFLKLQEMMLEVSILKGQLELELQSHQDQKSHNLLLEYISHRIQKLSQINSNYLDLQTKLLNTFLTIQTQVQQLQEQSLQAKQQTVSSLQKYFEQRLQPNLGFTISNQDNYCEQVKNKIMELGKAEFMMRQWKKETINDEVVMDASKKDDDEIKFYRNNLEWLLVMFQGSMDQKIFEIMMDKLNFQAQEHLQKEKKLAQFITELNKYINDLKNLLKSHPLSQIHPKIYKIIKDRIQLYQIISDIYTECLLVFKQTKHKDPQFNIQNKGLMLFDEEVFKYVLMVYQFSNKLRMEMNELKELMLPSRTKNYLIDQIYQPFAIRYGQHLNFKEEELLNFTLRLQHALNLQHNQKKILTLFQQTLQKPYSEEYFSILSQLCKQLSQINHQNNLILKLQNQPVVIHNLPKFKQLILTYGEYYKLVQEIGKDIQRDDQEMKSVKKMELNNVKVITLRNLVVDRWNEAYGRQQNNQNRENDSGENQNNNEGRKNQILERVDSKVSKNRKYSNHLSNRNQKNTYSRLITNNNRHQPQHQHLDDY